MLIKTLACAMMASVVAVAEPPEAPPRARVEILAETTALIAGKANELALAFRIEKGWHLYYNGQNDTGFPPTIERLTMPEGFVAREVKWPVPVRHLSAGDILDHIYEERVTLLLPVEVPETAAGSEAEITVSLGWLVCNEACVPGEQTVVLRLPVVRGEAVASASKAEFERARALLPVPLMSSDVRATATWIDGRVILTAGRPEQLREKSGEARHVEFYPAAESLPIRDLIATGTSESGKLELSIAQERHSGSEKPMSVRGMFAIWGEGKDAAKSPPIVFWVELPMPGGNQAPDGSSKKQPHGMK
ncbi:MAG: protein-disulfide reductase DsbD domain-containing protein [Phycisphaerales bacterium]